MCTWIELRCNSRVLNKACLSNANEGPMELSGDTRAEINATLKLLARVATESGWCKAREGWVCPRCLARP